MRRAVGALVLAAIAGVAVATVREEARERDRSMRDAAARTAAEAIESYLDGIVRQVGWLVRPDAANGRAADAAYVIETVPAARRLDVVDPDGRVSFSTARTGVDGERADPAALRHAALATEPGTPWMSPVRAVGDARHASLAVEREAAGPIAVADLDLAFLGEVLDGVRTPPGVSFALRDEAGTPILGGDPEGETTDVPLPQAGWLLRAAVVPHQLPPLLPVLERWAALAVLVGGLVSLGRRLFRRRP